MNGFLSSPPKFGNGVRVFRWKVFGWQPSV
jgi:hypothetical protein